jgi:hypothetical protein
MSAGGREHFDEVVGVLDQMGVMSLSDVPLVAMCAETRALWQRAWKEYQSAGQRMVPKGWRTITVEEVDGAGNVQTVKRDMPTGLELMPAGREFVELSKLLIRYYEQMGMSPTARARLEAPPVGPGATGGNKGTPDDEFFNKPGEVPPALKISG